VAGVTLNGSSNALTIQGTNAAFGTSTISGSMIS
jgi:hypothetical protein